MQSLSNSDILKKIDTALQQGFDRKNLSLKRLLIFFTVTAGIAVALLVMHLNWKYSDAPVPVNGVLDLTGWDLGEGMTTLTGEWKFYWNQMAYLKSIPAKKAEMLFFVRCDCSKTSIKKPQKSATIFFGMGKAARSEYAVAAFYIRYRIHK